MPAVVVLAEQRQPDRVGHAVQALQAPRRGAAGEPRGELEARRAGGLVADAGRVPEFAEFVVDHGIAAVVSLEQRLEVVVVADQDVRVGGDRLAALGRRHLARADGRGERQAPFRDLLLPDVVADAQRCLDQHALRGAGLDPVLDGEQRAQRFSSTRFREHHAAVALVDVLADIDLVRRGFKHRRNPAACRRPSRGTPPRGAARSRSRIRAGGLRGFSR